MPKWCMRIRHMHYVSLNDSHNVGIFDQNLSPSPPPFFIKKTFAFYSSSSHFSLAVSFSFCFALPPLLSILPLAFIFRVECILSITHSFFSTAARSQLFWYRFQLYVFLLLLVAATAAGLWRAFKVLSIQHTHRKKVITRTLAHIVVQSTCTCTCTYHSLYVFLLLLVAATAAGLWRAFKVLSIQHALHERTYTHTRSHCCAAWK